MDANNPQVVEEEDNSLLLVIGVVIAVIVLIYFLNKRKRETVANTPLQPRTNVGSSSTPATPVVKKTSKAKEIPSDLIPVKIFFGSQTGTAEDFSHRLAAEAKQYKFFAEVIDLEDYEPDDLSNEKLAIFVVATYGEGEPTDNCRTFFEWLNGTQEADLLKSLKFTVFGLGNKTYEHFNFIGRKFDKRLEEMGATRLFKRGEGDDDGNIEDDFSAWKKELWPVLCGQFGIKIEEKDATAALMERRFSLKKFASESREAQQGDNIYHLAYKKGSAGTYDAKNPFLAKIAINRELHTEKSDRSCRHIEIDVGNSLRYETGDHLGIYPENDLDLVNAVAARLKVELTSFVSLYQAGKETGRPVFGPCSIKKVLSQWCDLTSMPRKNVLRVFAEYAKDEKDRKFLLELSSDDHEPYGRYVKEYHRTVLEILNEFPSVEIPFDHFVEIVPRLKARMYSISSSPKLYPKSIHVTAVIVSYTTPNNRLHKGVCTNWLKNQIPKEGGNPIYVPVFVEKASFRLPKDPKIPIVMVGPGTGLAPFRGFIQDRSLKKEGENWLFFGCRRRDTDYIYADELEKAEKEGIITLKVAFSRESESKVYVQHKLLESGEKVWDLLETQKGYFYICGDARDMARDVRKSLKEIVMKYGNRDDEAAEKWLNDLMNQARYHSDVWS